MNKEKAEEKIFKILNEQIYPLYVENQLMHEIEATFILSDEKNKRVELIMNIRPELVIKKEVQIL